MLQSFRTVDSMLNTRFESKMCTIWTIEDTMDMVFYCYAQAHSMWLSRYVCLQNIYSSLSFAFYIFLTLCRKKKKQFLFSFTKSCGDVYVCEIPFDRAINLSVQIRKSSCSSFLLHALCLATEILLMHAQCPSKTFSKTMRHMDEPLKKIYVKCKHTRRQKKKHQHHLFAWMLEILFSFFFVSWFIYSSNFIVCLYLLLLI